MKKSDISLREKMSSESDFFVMKMFPPSLVKYENPRLVTTHSDGFDMFETKKTKDARRSPDITDDLESEDEKDLEIEEDVEVLDILLPPRKYEEAEKLWIQRVSRTPATENDILNLQDQFDKELTVREAREIGICPIRRNLYSQCFDELIRQEIIACPERGKLYKRIRNETQMTVDTLRKVYESNIAYGIKKVLTKTKHDEDMKAELEKKMVEKTAISQRLEELQEELVVIQDRLKEEEAELIKSQEEQERKLKEIIEIQMEDMKAFLDKDFLEYDNE